MHYVEGPAKERGVRVVCPDHPGAGRSDAHPQRTIPGYADDVSALADAMGLERFAVLGYSGGASYALACGARLPERVSAVGIMAGAGPHDRPGSREGCSKSDLMLLDLSKAALSGSADDVRLGEGRLVCSVCSPKESG